MLWMGKAFGRLLRERAGESGSCHCGPGQNVEHRPSALPAAHRKGEASAERYRQQSKGQLPRGNSFRSLAAQTGGVSPRWYTG
jgi:hypothetical protein